MKITSARNCVYKQLFREPTAGESEENAVIVESAVNRPLSEKVISRRPAGEQSCSKRHVP